MKRREFMSLLGGAAVAGPLAARAQQPAGRLPRIGILYFGWNENIAAFLQGLRDGGYIDGQSAIIEARYYGTLLDRLPELAKDLVALNCDVIYAAAPYAIQAAMKATSTISIVGATWKAILWRAGGRGLSLVQAATLPERSSIFPNLAASRLSCLRMPSQDCRVWRFSGIPRSAACSFVPRRQRRAQRGSHCNSLPIQRAEDFNSAFDRAARERIDGMIVLSSPIIQGQRSEIAALALETHLPTISVFTVFPRFGTLMAYGPNLPDMNKRAGTYVDRILKGAKAGELPIERPTKFELVVNLKTAKALGLTIPESFLLRADEVIE